MQVEYNHNINDIHIIIRVGIIFSSKNEEDVCVL